MELAAPSTSGRQVHAARLQLTLLDPQRLRELWIVASDLLDEALGVVAARTLARA
jgi:hypothetical protein